MSPEPTSDTIRAPMRTAIPVRSLTDEFAFPGGRSTGDFLLFARELLATWLVDTSAAQRLN